jgi:hypothetical protein
MTDLKKLHKDIMDAEAKIQKNNAKIRALIDRVAQLRKELREMEDNSWPQIGDKMYRYSRREQKVIQVTRCSVVESLVEECAYSRTPEAALKEHDTEVAYRRLRQLADGRAENGEGSYIIFSKERGKYEVHTWYGEFSTCRGYFLFSTRQGAVDAIDELGTVQLDLLFLQDNQK